MHKEHLEKYLFHSECSTIMLLLLFSDWETQFFASVSALDHTSFRMCPLPGYAQSGVLMGGGGHRKEMGRERTRVTLGQDAGPRAMTAGGQAAPREGAGNKLQRQSSSGYQAWAVPLHVPGTWPGLALGGSEPVL